MTYSGDGYSSPPYSGSDDATAEGLTIRPATVLSGQVVPGPAAPFPNVRQIRPAPADRPDVVPGPQAPPDPTLRRPITPMPGASGQIVPGPWLILTSQPTDPTVPTIPAGPARVANAITVPGYPGDVKAVTANPSWNAPGNATVTIDTAHRQEPPEDGAVMGVNVAGRRVFTGLVDRSTQVAVPADEEAGQSYTMELDGLLAEWGEVVVLPDLAARDTSRIGPPTQDSRVFDWTMNGIGNESFGEAAANIVPSLSIDATQAALNNQFQLPDVWPDPTARWMWVADPNRPSQPRGFCHFRVPTSRRSGRLQLWACAYDYAEVWMDGVPLLTCDQPGVAQFVELESDYDYHLLTIKAYNAGGKAGVLCTLLPVNEDGSYGTPAMNSRSNWKALAYPSRTFVSTPGQVLRRLVSEAVSRGVWPGSGAGSWRMDFGDLVDSAGRPWTRAEPITLEVGMTYLDVLNRLAEDRMDYAPTPAGRTLRCWVKDEGSGGARSPLWVPGVDLKARAIKRTVR